MHRVTFSLPSASLSSCRNALAISVGISRRGQAHLAALRKRETPPILLKTAAVRALPESAQRLYALGAAAHDFYTLAYPCAAARKMGEDWRSRPVLVEDA